MRKRIQIETPIYSCTRVPVEIVEESIIDKFSNYILESLKIISKKEFIKTKSIVFLKKY